MVKPLSAMKYFVENKKKAMVVIITLFFAVFCISFITTIINSIFASAKDSNIAPLSKFTFIDPPRGQTFMPKDSLAKIKEYDSVDKVYPIMANNTSITTVFGNTSAPVIYSNNETELNEIFDRCNLKMKKGRMPKVDSYEIIMHSSMMKNKKLKVGDKFGDEVDSSEWVTGTYTIVGEFDGDSVVALGTKNYYLASLEKQGVDIKNCTVSALAYPKNDNIEAMNKQLDSVDKKTAFITSKSTVLKQLDEQLASINSIMSIVIFVVTFGMAVCVGTLIYNFYSARNNEFGILYAIGYNKSNVKRLIFKELIIISVIGWAIGYVFSFLCFLFVDKLLFAPLGQKMLFFTWSGLIYTFIVPVLVFICAAFPILRSLSKKDLVAIIERRG